MVDGLEGNFWEEGLPLCVQSFKCPSSQKFPFNPPPITPSHISSTLSYPTLCYWGNYSWSSIVVFTALQFLIRCWSENHAWWPSSNATTKNDGALLIMVNWEAIKSQASCWLFLINSRHRENMVGASRGDYQVDNNNGGRKRFSNVKRSSLKRQIVNFRYRWRHC